MWFLRFVFKKTFDAEFIMRFFRALAEHIPHVQLEWKKGSITVAQTDASSAEIKVGKKVLFCQNSRSGWIDPFAAGDGRLALLEVAKQFELGKDKPNYLLSFACLALYALIVSSTLSLTLQNINENSLYSLSICAALLATGLMLLSYRFNWSHTQRSVVTTIWILAMIAGLFSSVLLLPLVWAYNREQLRQYYLSD